MKKGRSSPKFLEAGTSVARYLIIRLLGQGGMGVVYEAFDPELNRKIAIKFLRTKPTNSNTSSQSAQARILAKAQSLAQISHPNVVAIYDIGTVQDSVFLAMELAQGDTLLKWIEHKQPKTTAIIKKLRSVGEGLAATHQLGIVHQDIKPDNIIVGSDGSVRLHDFGLASHTNKPLIAKMNEVEASAKPSDDSSAVSTHSTSHSTDFEHTNHRYPTNNTKQRVMGTPSYMSPEQHLGGRRRSPLRPI